MRQRKTGKFVPRGIDRIVFALLGAVCLSSSAYVVGPWYLEIRVDGDEAPLFNLFNDTRVVLAYGMSLGVVSLGLFFAALISHRIKGYTTILLASLLSGFLLRLYDLISVFMALESWRPPTYISQAATIVILGSYWVWVRVYARTPE